MSDIQIFEPDGRAVSYAVEGGGPALVLIAGQAHDVAYLGPLAQSVSEAHFRVVRIGSRGLPDGEAVVSMHDLARDVVDVMDHLGLEDAWVGGHAFGGSIARTVALDYHDRVNGVLLLGVESDAPETLAEGLPVLVVQGADDHIAPAANGDALMAAAPDRVSVVTLDGAGHMFPATHVGATSWAIEDYLDWD